MTRKSSKIPDFDAVFNKNENNQATIHDSKYGTTRVLFASTYTAKQMKTMYYSLNIKQQLRCVFSPSSLKCTL